MKNLRKYSVITKVSFSNAIAYRATTVSRFFFYALFIYVFLGLWRAIYQGGNVHGYSYVQMVWYLIMTELISFSCNTGMIGKMNEEIKSGSIAYDLGRPVHYVWYQFASSLGQILFGLIAFGAMACVLGLAFVGPLPGFRLTRLPPLLLSVTLSVTLNHFSLMLIGLSAFMFEDNFAFYLIYQKINFMLGMFLPVEFLPAWLQPVAKNLPFSYVYWAPAKIFVSDSLRPGMDLITRQGAWAAFSALLVFFCYHRSVRRLQVNGG